MTERLTLMAVHAHPDDECMSTGGVLARYAREGLRTVLVTATCGEEGEVVDPEMNSVCRATLTVPPQSTTSMILPTLRLSSMYWWAAAASASGNEVSIIGRILPCSNSGNQRSRKRCVMTILCSRD